MNLSGLTLREVAQSLRRDGICLHIGSYAVRIRSPFPDVAYNLHLLYADYPVEPDAPFADFHISVDRPRNLRRWFAPQAIFRIDNYVPFKPLPADQAYPLLEWSLNWCISTQFHRYLVIHGAVLERNGSAVILPAPPGSGKSTLCAALATRGWRLLSDELALIDPATLDIVPMCRPISLKNQSIDIIRQFDESVAMGPSAFDTTKGTVAHMKVPPSALMRSSEPARARWLVFPKYEAGAAITLRSHPKASAFMKLAENTFNYSMLGAVGFDTLVRVIDQCECQDFTYSSLDEAIALFDEMSAR